MKHRTMTTEDEDIMNGIRKLTFDEYENAARVTAVYPGTGTVQGLTYTALGLAGEAGEFADHVKKLLRDEGGEMTEGKRASLAKELGDVLWYVSQAANELNLTMQVVAAGNLQKLADRQERGALGGSGDDR